MMVHLSSVFILPILAAASAAAAAAAVAATPPSGPAAINAVNVVVDHHRLDHVAADLVGHQWPSLVIKMKDDLVVSSHSWRRHRPFRHRHRRRHRRNVQHKQQQQQQHVELLLSPPPTTTPLRRRNLQEGASTNNHVAWDTCQSSLIVEQDAGLEAGAVCKCESLPQDQDQDDDDEYDDDGVLLTCTDTACTYCLENGRACSISSYSVVFQQSSSGGLAVEYWERNVYLHGDGRDVVYKEKIDNGADEVDVTACILEVDGTQCASCRYDACSSDEEYWGLTIDCTNIIGDDGTGGEVLDSCQEPEDSVSGIGTEEAAASTTATDGSLFAMYDDNYGFCFTATDACDRDILEMEGNGDYTCQCTNVDGDDTANAVTQLECTRTCTLCNSQITQCVDQSSFTRSYQSYTYKPMSTTTKAVYTAGRPQLPLQEPMEVLVEETLLCDPSNVNGPCDDTTPSLSCRITINNQECNSCEMRACHDDDGENHRPFVNCENLDASWTNVDFCRHRDETERQSNMHDPFEFYFDGNGDDYEYTCLGAGKWACAERRFEIESSSSTSSSPPMECTCSRDSNNACGITNLQCETTCGDVCLRVDGSNGIQEDICFRDRATQTFQWDGSVSVPYERTTQYTIGLRQEVVYTEFPLSDGTSDSPSCLVQIDGTSCLGCSFQQCPDNTVIPMVDCTNVNPTAVINSCDVSDDIVSFLIRFLPVSFDICEERIPANGSCNSATRLELPNPDVSIVVSSSTIMVESDSFMDPCTSQNAPSSSIWYTLNGNGVGLEASVCNNTDFDAEISVYTGSECTSPELDEFECVKHTGGNDCRINWSANNRQLYFVRVHGTDSEVGNFDMAISTIDYAMESCKAMLQLVVAIKNHQYSCSCLSNESNGNVLLECNDECIVCDDDETSLCGKREQSWTFSGVTGEVIQQRETFRYLTGRNKTRLTIEKSLDRCQVFMNDVSCNACNVIQCNDPSTREGLDISCANIDENVVINTCQRQPNPAAFIVTNKKSNILDAAFLLYGDVLSTCRPRDASMICLEHMSKQISISKTTEESAMDCRCAQDTLSGGYLLECVDMGCLQCDYAYELCGFPTIATPIGENGAIVESAIKGFSTLTGDQIFRAEDTVSKSAELDISIPVETCLEVKDPSFECFASRDEAMLRNADATDASSSQFICNCHSAIENNSSETTLICSTTASSGCEYCNAQDTLCARRIQFGRRYNPAGYAARWFQAFQYTEGGNELVVVEYTGRTCSVTINGQYCNSCQRNGCGSNSLLPFVWENAPGDGALLDMLVDCSNLEGRLKATFQCGNVTANKRSGMGNTEHGVLSVLAAGTWYFPLMCASENDTRTPSSAPTVIIQTDEPSAMPHSTLSPSFLSTSPATSVGSSILGTVLHGILLFLGWVLFT